MKLKPFISLTWAICSALPSLITEYAAQLEPRVQSDDDSLWTDNSFNSESITYDMISASDADVEGFVSESNPPLSISSGSDIDGPDYDHWIDLIQDDSIAYIGNAGSLEDACLATSPPAPYSKLQPRNDAYCPSPQAAPLAPDRVDTPSLPNIMELPEPWVPDVPLFNFKSKDDQQCPGRGYRTHLCCDGPRGKWEDEWSHYGHVYNCLPCTVPFHSPSPFLLLHCLLRIPVNAVAKCFKRETSEIQTDNKNPNWCTDTVIGSCQTVYHEWCCSSWFVSISIYPNFF